MANLVTFAKKLWKDATSGGTPITAAELNRIESGVNDCATQINRIGDSVSQIGNIESRQVLWQSQSETTDLMLKRTWASIKTVTPTILWTVADSNGQAMCGIAYKHSDKYGAFIDFGYSRGFESWKLLDGLWIKE